MINKSEKILIVLFVGSATLHGVIAVTKLITSNPTVDNSIAMALVSVLFISSVLQQADIRKLKQSAKYSVE